MPAVAVTGGSPPRQSGSTSKLDVAHFLCTGIIRDPQAVRYPDDVSYHILGIPHSRSPAFSIILTDVYSYSDGAVVEVWSEMKGSFDWVDRGVNVSASNRIENSRSEALLERRERSLFRPA